MCQACLEKNYGSPFSRSAKAGRSHSKVVTFGGVTEIEQPIDTVMSSEGEETELLRRLRSKATVAMPTIGLGSQLSERERRYGRGQIQDNLSYSGLNPTPLALVWTALRNRSLSTQLHIKLFNLIACQCHFGKCFTFHAHLN